MLPGHVGVCHVQGPIKTLDSPENSWLFGTPVLPPLWKYWFNQCMRLTSGHELPAHVTSGQSVCNQCRLAFRKHYLPKGVTSSEEGGLLLVCIIVFFSTCQLPDYIPFPIIDSTQTILNVIVCEGGRNRSLFGFTSKTIIPSSSK